MNFSELEQLMSSRDVTSLAEIARALNTTPQAVSNWKARNQVPYHIVAKLNQIADKPPIYPLSTTHNALPSTFEENTISLTDILITMAEQLKVIILVPFITVFLTFSYILLIQPAPPYVSKATFLLPASGLGSSGAMGIAAQFGLSVPQGATGGDLTSPTLFPELVNSRTFAEKILDETFYSEKYGQKLQLLAILTHGTSKPVVGIDTLRVNAIEAFRGMVLFEKEGSFSVLSVATSEAVLSRDINVKILDELEKTNRFFKTKSNNEKIRFIQSRIGAVEVDLETSEQSLKLFREQNRQVVASPSLQLQAERLTRDTEIQKGIYLTLKQQLELANIEKIQQGSVIQILDKPQVPLSKSGKNLKGNVFLAGILGIGLGILLGFARSYLDNSNIEERKKLRRVKNFIKKKSKDFLLDYRICGIISLLMLVGLPYYLGHESRNPIFFGMYSAKFMLFNCIYVLTLLFLSGLFIHLLKIKK